MKRRRSAPNSPAAPAPSWSSARAVRAVEAIENRLISARGNHVARRSADAAQEEDAGAIEALITMSAEPTLEGIVTGAPDAPSVMIRTRKKTIVPRSAMQIDYMRALASKDIIFALGPAGTGKTYVAVAQAVSQLITGSVDRLILSRPAVEAGERLGFLPGDMKEKVDPYLRPLYDALYDMMPPEQVERASPRARSRSRRSPSCAAARWPMPSSSSTRRRTPRPRR
jgi:phosphate starvation-inducible protein PhoH